MNKTLIVEASDSDCRPMSGMLTKGWYEPITTEEWKRRKSLRHKLHKVCLVLK